MDYIIDVRAGTNGENSDVYRYVSSPVPKNIKSVDDPLYRTLSSSALEVASEIVRITGKNITLKLSIEER